MSADQLRLSAVIRTEKIRMTEIEPAVTVPHWDEEELPSAGRAAVRQRPCTFHGISILNHSATICTGRDGITISGASPLRR